MFLIHTRSVGIWVIPGAAVLPVLAWLSALNPYSISLSAHIFTFIGGRSGLERPVPVTEYLHTDVAQTTSAYISLAEQVAWAHLTSREREA